MYRNLLVETGVADFVPITTSPIATDARSSQTLQWIDVDDDGDLDLFAINYNTVPCQLYRNDGAGVFTKITTGAIVTDLGNAHGGTWGDFDDDGDLDVFIATDLGQSNRYYRNDGGATFTRITSGGFVNEARSNYGAASGDFDRDGDLDLFVPTARSEGPSVLWRNDTPAGNHWLEVTLTGTLSNRSGIGARVRVLARIGGQPRWMLRTIQAGTGYGGHDALEAHVGLGDAAGYDSLIVEWPSGVRTALGADAGDRRIVLVEDASTETLDDGHQKPPGDTSPAQALTLSTAGGLPGGGPLRVIVETPRAIDAVFVLLDAQGRRVADPLRRSLAAGRHEVPLDPGDSLRTGAYWVRLAAGSERRAIRVTRLR
jgi:hypothetical protein